MGRLQSSILIMMRSGSMSDKSRRDRILSIDVNEEIYEMVEDWRYWCERF